MQQKFGTAARSGQDSRRRSIGGMLSTTLSATLSATLALGLSFSLVSCGGSPQSRTQDNSATTPVSPNVTASASPSPSASPTAKPNSKTEAPSAAKPDQAKPATSEPSNPAPNAATEPKATAPSPNPAQPLAAGKTEETTIYHVDSECSDFVAEKVTVPSQDTADALVGKVLAAANSPDFKIDNYRVQVENGTATIDLRLPPDAKRPFTAMSACEQQAILGSLQKTLTSQPKLKIQAVRFTDGKEPLEF